MMTINLLISSIVVLAIIVVLFFWLRKSPDNEAIDLTKFDPKTIQTFIRNAMQKSITDNSDFNLSEEEYNRLKERQNLLRQALRTCMQGNVKMKKYVKSKMYTMLEKSYGINDKNIDLIIPFSRTEQLSIQDKFDILLYHFQKKHKFDALDELIQKYKLDQLKKMPDGTEGYMISSDEIKQIYAKERPMLTFKDKLNIVVQKVYQHYKGLGVIDELRDMNIDGVNGGTSGLPTTVSEKMDLMQYVGQLSKVPLAHDSVWIFYRAKSIYLECLSFGSEKELKRVCQNIYTHGYPGQLNESVGYKINDMADGSRIVVVRPTLGESWAFFVRKFNDDLVAIEDLIKDENASTVIELIYFFVRGLSKIAVTGDQGAGKTTLLKVICGFIHPTLNIRVLETAFELFLRKFFMYRNIFSMRETMSISTQEALDMSKKTDGGVIVLGEVASHPLASLAVQISQAASAMVLLTHHATSVPSLIEWFSDALSGKSKQAISLIDINIHLEKTPYRHLDRITEIIALTEDQPYPRDYRNQGNIEGKMSAFMDTMVDYFEKRTNPKTYTYNNIVEWRDGKFIAVHKPSERLIQRMITKMNKEDAGKFVELIEKIDWKFKPNVDGEVWSLQESY
ncbi:ATPase, T2SS/T4P/T4SS family [Paenibacillus cremeus]|nr:ATPase, T2SS/T4P/T4SS family [Paenibacillus cremeus]